MYVDRPVAVPGPCLRADEVPKKAEDLSPLRFYFCLKTADGQPDEGVVCESDAHFRELILRFEILYDFVEKARRLCVDP